MSGYGDRSFLGFLAPPSPVVKRLLIANAVVFAFQVLAMPLRKTWVFDNYLALSGAGLESLRLWQVFTYMFLHGGIWHILLNLLVLWMFGRDVEFALGARHFLRMYVLGGVIGGLLWTAFNFSSGSVLMGASGAVLSVVIAFATLYPERPITLLLFFVLPVTLKAKYLAWLTVALVVYGCLVAANSKVADLAHLGGIVVGYVYVKWLGHGWIPSWLRQLGSARRRRRPYFDEFHSSRPGIPFSHPYRSLDERETQSGARRRGLFSRLRRTRASERARPEIGSDEYISKEIDPILDKIAKHGIQSLTRRERKILEEAREKIGKQS